MPRPYRGRLSALRLREASPAPLAAAARHWIAGMQPNARSDAQARSLPGTFGR